MQVAHGVLHIQDSATGTTTQSNKVLPLVERLRVARASAAAEITLQRYAGVIGGHGLVSVLTKHQATKAEAVRWLPNGNDTKVGGHGKAFSQVCRITRFQVHLNGHSSAQLQLQYKRFP